MKKNDSRAAEVLATAPRPSRRAMLGGAGALVGLPFLESLCRPGAARAAEPPRRFLAFFLPCGIHMPSWRLSAEGRLGSLSPTLAPLDKVKEKLNVLSGLQQNQLAGFGAHNYGPAGFLTCRRGASNRMSVGVSLDQTLARALRGGTKVPSLQLGINDGADGTGHLGIYSRAISWGSETQPLLPTTRPAVAFDTLFAGFDSRATDAERARRQATRKSVLDYVRLQATALEGKLASSDRLKLDEYLTGVRELERKVTVTTAPAGSCAPGMRPPTQVDTPTKVKLMIDLAVLAFRCDVTRVITFQLGNGGFGSLTFPFLGIPENHHPISHHGRRADQYEKLKKIDLWEVRQFASLVEKLDAISEGPRTLLDNSLVYLSSEISDGDRHNFDDLPVVLAGRAGGALAAGRHLSVRGEPVGKLFVSFMNLLGVNATSFAGSTGRLPKLT